MTKYTAPPWKVLKAGDGFNRIGPDDGHGYVATIRMRPSKTNNTEELRANTRLLNAAPDMLAALQFALPRLEKITHSAGDDFDMAISKVLASITDAT